MINLWNNLPLDIRAIALTVVFFVGVIVLSLLPIWALNVVLTLLFIFAIYVAARAVLTATDLKRKWDAEDKEGK